MNTIDTGRISFENPPMIIDQHGGTRKQFQTASLTPEADLVWSFETNNGHPIQIIKGLKNESEISITLPIGTYDLLYGSDSTLISVCFNPHDIMRRFINTLCRDNRQDWMNEVVSRIAESPDLAIEILPHKGVLYLDHDESSEGEVDPVPLIRSGPFESAEIQDHETGVWTNYIQTYQFSQILVSYENNLPIESQFRRTITPFHDFYRHPTKEVAMKHLKEIVMSTI